LELRLVLDLEPDNDTALLRVFSTLHRRRCRVIEVAYGAGRLTLCVEAPALYAHRVEHWLGALVDVRSAAMC
jgi:hypothetical protein